MRSRALSFEADSRRSMLRFIAHQHVDLARAATVAGERIGALRWLLQVPQGMRTRRWWVALCMANCWPTAAILGFQQRVQSDVASTGA